MKKNNNEKKYKKPITGAYITQPISQADKREVDSRVAMPDDENVDLNRQWSIDNKL